MDRVWDSQRTPRGLPGGLLDDSPGMSDSALFGSRADTARTPVKPSPPDPCATACDSPSLTSPAPPPAAPPPSPPPPPATADAPGSRARTRRPPRGPRPGPRRPAPGAPSASTAAATWHAAPARRSDAGNTNTTSRQAAGTHDPTTPPPSGGPASRHAPGYRCGRHRASAASRGRRRGGRSGRWTPSRSAALSARSRVGSPGPHVQPPPGPYATSSPQMRQVSTGRVMTRPARRRRPHRPGSGPSGRRASRPPVRRGTDASGGAGARGRP